MTIQEDIDQFVWGTLAKSLILNLIQLLAAYAAAHFQTTLNQEFLTALGFQMLDSLRKYLRMKYPNLSGWF